MNTIQVGNTNRPRQTDLVNSKLWLKSTHSAHIEGAALSDAGLAAIEEVLAPCYASGVLTRTPIVVTGKAADCGFLQVHLVQFVFRWQKPVTVIIENKIVTNACSNSC